MELTNNIRKLVASLGASKHRRQEGVFKAEGTKCVLDTLPHFKVRYLIATDEWLSVHDEVSRCGAVVTASHRDLERMSDLKSASDVIAVYDIPEQILDIPTLSGRLVLALDSVQDPGNLGTIIRTADWFGVRDIICSRTTADLYNPKVVQATMGAISRIRVHYTDLEKALTEASALGMPVFGTLLDGVDIYTSELSPSGVIVMGNEGNGLSEVVGSRLNHRLLIPSYPPSEPTSESLNVAIATAICLSEFRRRL